jgi:integrase
LIFADILPTIDGMKRSKRSKPEIVKVGNVTVRIYKRRRATARGEFRTIYEVTDYTAGKRRLRGFSDPEAASNEALKIARQIASGETTASAMRNNEAASYGRACELLRPTCVTLEIAAAQYAKAFEILGGDTMIEAARFYKRHRANQVTRKPVAEVVAEVVALKKSRGLSASYTNDLRNRLTRFAKAFGANPSTITEPDLKDEAGNDTRNRGVDISTVDTSDAQRWLDSLKLGTQSVKNFRTVLHTLFEFAETRGYVFKGGNPVADTESISVNGGDIQIFTPDEIAALLKSATPDFLPFVAIGAFAGLRSAEIERIEWRDVDLSGGFITVASGNAKTRRRRLMPIAANLAAWLKDYTNHSGKVWKGTPNNLQDARAACVKASGIAWRDNGLRHSFASYRLAQIQNAAQVALEMGNSADVVFKHYREIVKPSDAKAWFAVAPEMPSNVTALAAARFAK